MKLDAPIRAIVSLIVVLVVSNTTFIPPEPSVTFPHDAPGIKSYTVELSDASINYRVSTGV